MEAVDKAYIKELVIFLKEQYPEYRFADGWTTMNNIHLIHILRTLEEVANHE